MSEFEGLRRRNLARKEKEIEESEDSDHKDEDDDAFQDSDENTGTEWPLGTYWLTRVVFLRSVAFVYFTAFIVALNQNKALIGDKGMLPAKKHLEMYENYFKNAKWQKYLSCPTLLWFADWEHIDAWLDGIAYCGIAISFITLIYGAANIFMMFSLWVLYHSIVNVGQTWYGFGWESQLLETGFLAIFFCPLFTVKRFPKNSHPSSVVLNGYRWLIFRIMLGAGLIKIRGDQCWRDLTCMNYHYQTQPVPNPLSYYLHQSPEYMHKLETAGNHIVELFVPFLLFWPRKARLTAGIMQIAFQVVLILSGNLSFLNWLTILPSICCFDDASIQWMFNAETKTYVKRMMHLRSIEKCRKKYRKSFGEKFRSFVHFMLFCLIAYLSLPVLQNLVSQRQAMNRSFDPLRIVNTYGAFGSVTKTRTEVILQGTYSKNPNSDDAVWLDYEFKCKPGNVTRRPCMISPYHHRLDWLMWFAAFQNAERNPWFMQLISKLLQNDPKVTDLIEKNPFQGQDPPKYIRAEHYKYKYTPIGSAAAQNGKWWRRKRIGTYLQPVNLKLLRGYLTSRGFDVPRLN